MQIQSGRTVTLIQIKWFSIKKFNLLQTIMILGYHLPVKSYISSPYNLLKYDAHFK